MPPRHILVAVAWPYANGSLHLGHIGGAYLPADIFARYNRMAGNRVLMVSGSDKHGTLSRSRLTTKRTTPQAIVDKFHPEFLRYWDELGISFDLFTTTGTKNHEEVVHDFFMNLMRKAATSTRAQRSSSSIPRPGASCPTATSRGPAPTAATRRRAATSATTAAVRSTPTSLIEPRSRLTGATPEMRETSTFSFAYGGLQISCSSGSRAGKAGASTSRTSIGWLEEGLRDRAITRDLEWGVTIPVEATSGRASASTSGSRRSSATYRRQRSGRSRRRPDAWRAWWEDQRRETYYFIGKDNISFHTSSGRRC